MLPVLPPAFPSACTDAVEVRASRVHGAGVFALRSLPPGLLVGVYEGRRYAPSQAREREWDGALTYLFGLSDGTLIDASEGGNATRHINHSCEPNCQANEEADDDKKDPPKPQIVEKKDEPPSPSFDASLLRLPPRP